MVEGLLLGVVEVAVVVASMQCLGVRGVLVLVLVLPNEIQVY